MKSALVALALVLVLPGAVAWAEDCTNGDCPPPDDPGCTNGDCPPPDDPGCTNGDCPPPDDPGCTNGDCPPPDDPGCTNGDCPTQNQPPIAQCKDVTVQTSPQGACSALADIDNDSFDPDGDPITLAQDPPSPYSTGEMGVTLTVTDDSGDVDSCIGTVTVIDAEFPVIHCNSPATITPPDAPITFTATATDNCGVSGVSVVNYDCYWYNPADKRVDKTSSCAVSVSGDTLGIHDTGGVNDNIEWVVEATDTSGNVFSLSCATRVVNPSQ